MTRQQKDEVIYEAEALKNPFKKVKFELPAPQKHKIDFEFQELGLKMTDWFEGERKSWIWSLFYKYPVGVIREAFEVCKKSRNKKVKYLIGIIKKSLS